MAFEGCTRALECECCVIACDRAFTSCVFVSTLCREVPGNCVWFFTYEGVSRALLARQRAPLPPGAPAPALRTWEVSVCVRVL
jgi:hypothetical protein